MYHFYVKEEGDSFVTSLLVWTITFTTAHERDDKKNLNKRKETREQREGVHAVSGSGEWLPLLDKY